MSPTETPEAGAPNPGLDRVFAALADPIRRDIIARLAERESTVSELAEPYAVSLPAISRHLKVLEAAGLISRTREAQFRGSRLRPDGMAEAAEWLERYRVLWDARLDRLGAHLREQARTASTRKENP